MFGRIGQSAVKHPWLTILAWVIAAAALISLAPQLKPTNDQADFLPSHYESVQVGKVQERAFPQQEQPASIAVFQRKDKAPLTAADKADVVEVVAGLDKAGLKKIKRIETNPQSVSANGKIALASILATSKDPYDADLMKSVEELRKQVKPLLKSTSLSMGITGQTATAVDTMQSSGNTDAMIMMATMALIVVLLLAIFRSPLIAFLPLIVISVVFMVANGLIATVSELGGLKTDASISSILIVVLFGVGTDYLLFLLFRYREHLRTGQEPKQAMADAVGKVGETIASAAGAVIVAFLALLLSSLGMFRAMGPALAISVGVTLVAALTLVPAVFSLLGTKVFWPSKAWRKQPEHRLSQRVGTLIGRRPGVVAAGSAGLLAVLAVGSLSFNPIFDSGSSLPKELESVRAMEDLQRGFAAGQTDPVWVLVHTDDGSKLDQAGLGAYAKELAAVDGVGTVAPPVTSPKGDVAQIAVMIDYRPTGDQAIELVSGPLRDAAHASAPKGTEALVGGTSGVMADVQDAVNHDYSLVFPAAGLAIMIILGLLLRSVVAPWYLMLAVGLGFAATLGSTVWLFQDLKGESGLLFTLPVILYLFVVAIGTDYNILMIARLREEVRRGISPAEATRHAIVSSASTIGAAAVILAGTFGVLLLAENTMLQQMGFAVAFGILLTAFVMAMLLVPAVTALLGRKAWWPGGKDHDHDRSASPDETPRAKESVGTSG
ncbi:MULTISPECIES: MMPL family transporter [unclassified Streptomyces]|uniref:MMPL family transporter n=1 Tax=unclassified Streptomyces TaxID=2593676 RepID=UPI0011E77666|nr:MMPL family transporter [Streptomyces sp. sk2.1]TXS67102.1 MMPL family transporter [Streptomyces sp. sk2.1]